MFIIVGIFVVVITTLLPRCCVIKAIKKKNIPKQKEGYLPIKIRGATEKVKKREFVFLRAGHGNYAKSADEEFNNFSERILGTTYFDFFGKINKLKRDYDSPTVDQTKKAWVANRFFDKIKKVIDQKKTNQKVLQIYVYLLRQYEPALEEIKAYEESKMRQRRMELLNNLINDLKE